MKLNRKKEDREQQKLNKPRIRALRGPGPFKLRREKRALNRSEIGCDWSTSRSQRNFSTLLTPPFSVDENDSLSSITKSVALGRLKNLGFRQEDDGVTEPTTRVHFCIQRGENPIREKEEKNAGPILLIIEFIVWSNNNLINLI